MKLATKCISYHLPPGRADLNGILSACEQKTIGNVIWVQGLKMHHGTMKVHSVSMVLVLGARV